MQSRSLGRRIADLIETESELTPLEAAECLGYPTVTHRGAVVIAEAQLRTRQERPGAGSWLPRVARGG
ncbi:hypothetical protein OHA03_44665, partial [Streptomyces sp. NBC_00154]|nr:hypothetical protein [Streptomyces sp. NBC_00154]